MHRNDTGIAILGPPPTAAGDIGGLVPRDQKENVVGHNDDWQVAGPARGGGAPTPPADAGRADRGSAERRPASLPDPRAVHRAGRELLGAGTRVAAGSDDADPRPRHVVRLRRDPGRRARGAVHARRRLPRTGGRDANRTGDVGGFAPPGDIHRVRNAGRDTAISIHVYGTDVSRPGSCVRRVYDQPILGEQRCAA